MPSLVGAILFVSLSIVGATSKRAYAYDCITNASGNLVCIHSVYDVPGTSYKRVVTSLNGGRPMAFSIDCANPNWDATSIYDKACSNYR